MDGLRKDIEVIQSQLSAQEKRIAFLEVFRDVHVQTIQRIHDLQAIEENQTRKFHNLEEKVDSLMFMFNMLEKMAPKDDRGEVLSLQRSLKSHLGRAKNRVAS